MKNLEFCFYNLHNGNTVYKTIETAADLSEGYKAADPTGQHDVELQFMDGNISSFAADYIGQLFELAAQHEVELETAAAILDATGSITDAERVLENGSYSFIEGSNETDAFMGYYEELGNMENIPDHLINYIDWKKMCQDHQYEGLGIHQKNHKEYIFFTV